MDVIKKCADEKKLQRLKFIFVDALDVDPTFEDYEEGYNYCKACGVLEPHQELTPFNNDPSKWDKTYWRQLKGDILENLSEKRIDHMREVAKVVHKDRIERILAERAERAAAQPRQQASAQASSPVQNHTPTTSATRTASSTTANNTKTEKQPPVRKTQPSITKEDIDKYNREQERIAAEKRAKEEIPTIKVESRKEDSNSKKALGIALTAAAVVAAVVIVAIIVK